MKIVDAFIFFHELDMLESRLQYLYDHVDYFVIVESNRSFVGKTKPLIFLENRDRYAPYLDKIIYAPFLWSDKEFEKHNRSPWDIEKEQRNYIAEAVKMFNERDIILISDVDEIPNIDCLNYFIKPYYQNNEIVYPALLIQEYLLYNLERKYSIPGTQYGWFLPFVTSKKYLDSYTVNNLRGFNGITDLPKNWFNNGGWHLSCFMPVNDIISKLQNFSHVDYLSEENQNPEKLQDWISKDLLYINGESGSIQHVSRDYYPEHFLRVFEKYFNINKYN